jgi:transcription elongation factor GreB
MPNYLTPEGAKKLAAELNQLLNVDRAKVVHEVAEAAAQGDRSENAEYIYGKKKLREIDRRIRFLSKRLDTMTVVTELPPEGTPTIFFGAWIELEDESGEAARYRLVGPDETDATRGYISINSPMGRALLRKRLDDEITVQRPKGEGVFTVLSVHYSDPGWVGGKYKR